MVGKTVSHYKILEKLGEGGMGVVYKAHDTELDRTVALKFLPHGLTTDEAEQARFMQEAKAASALNHPNICAIHSLGEHERERFIDMEFVDGKTLREIVPVKKMQDAITYAIQIAEALQEAHTHGIVHRDIKAENIMVNSKNQVKVMDFGLAKLKGSLKLTKTSSTVGTLAYMAPEQIQGEEIDARSDIFSFGIVLYEMLTGHLPFRGEHDAAMMYSIVNDEPEPLQHYIPDAQSELLHILDRAMEKDREDRYQSVHEMLIDLRRLKKDSSRVSRQHVPALEAPVAVGPAIPSVRRGIQRRWLLLGGVGLAVLCSGLVFVFLTRTPSVKLNPHRSVRALAVPFEHVLYGSLSKHGDWFVFPAKDDSGRFDIYWTSLAGGEPSRITHEKSVLIVNAGVSPNADLVVYSCNTDPSLFLFQIRIVPLQGGLSRSIADTGYGPGWTPDGKRIGYLRTGRRGSGSRAPSASGNLEIWSVKPDGTDCRLELRDSLSMRASPYSFCWSPDGRSIAWVRNSAEEGGEMMVHEFATGSERQLTSDRKTVDEVIWASNGDILFVSNKSGYSNLWAIPSEGGEAVQVTQGTASIISARISADTRKLVYVQYEQVSHIWISGLDGRNARQVTYDDVNFRWARFSPDARQIAGVIGNVDMWSPERHLVVMDRDGKNRRALTSGSQIASDCSWSLDGKWLAFTSRSVDEPPDSDKVYVIDPANPGTPRLLGSGYAPAWLDGENLVVSLRSKSWLYSIKGGTGTQVYLDSTNAVPLQRTGQMFYYDRRKGREGYWVVSMDSAGKEVGEPRRLQPPDNPYFVGPPDFRFRVYGKAGGNEFWRVWLASGKEERLGIALPGFTSIYDVSMDGNNLLWLEFRERSKLALIENLFE
jgi:serine/threonine protein kinase